MQTCLAGNKEKIWVVDGKAALADRTVRIVVAKFRFGDLSLLMVNAQAEPRPTYDDQIQNNTQYTTLELAETPHLSKSNIPEQIVYLWY